MSMAKFCIGEKDTPLYKIVKILAHVDEVEGIGQLALDNYMLEQCDYDKYHFRIDIREQLRRNGWVKYNRGEYSLTHTGRAVTRGFAQILPADQRPLRYRGQH